MMSTLRNHLTRSQQQDLQLEEKVMLAGLNVTFNFEKNVPDHVKAAVKKAMGFWNKTVSSKGKFVVNFEYAPVDGPNGSLAYTESPFSAPGLSAATGLIMGVDSADWPVRQSQDKQKQQQLFIALTHELGHLFGLGHKKGKGTIMAAQIDDTQLKLNRFQRDKLKQGGFTLLGGGSKKQTAKQNAAKKPTPKKQGGKQQGGNKLVA
jgi:hypothetical protein